MEEVWASGLGDVVAGLFERGGPFVYLTTAAWVVACAVVVERAARLFRYRLAAEPFVEQISKLVQGGNVDRAMKLCAAAPHAPLARVVAAALFRSMDGDAAIQRGVAEAVRAHRVAIVRRIGWLGWLGAIAVLVGLLGAALGMFQTLELLPRLSEPAARDALAQGGQVALAHAVFGLSVGLFCAVANLVLAAVARRMVEGMELGALRVEDALAQRG